MWIWDKLVGESRKLLNEATYGYFAHMYDC
jgi:hypothetical protein